MAPPAEAGPTGFHLWSVNLGNGPLGVDGDSIGVTTRWEWPEALAGVTGRDFERAAGNHPRRELAREQPGQRLGRQGRRPGDGARYLDRKADKARVKGIVASWLKAGSLLVVDGLDSKSMSRKFVEVAR